MTCEEARLALLDADPDVLRNAVERATRGATERALMATANSDVDALSDHMRGCDACRARAATITAGTDILRSALDMVVAVRASEQSAARAAEHALRARQESDDVALPIRVWPRRVRRVAVRVLVPLAAAAALVLMLLDVDGLRLSPAVAPFADLYLPEPEVPAAPVINAAGGSGVAVMRTTNPTITVVWTF